jgi:16S rRNA (guanine(966)-N(2))-methyltransferase RsmD
MRIITGKYRGRTIETVRDKSVRPATDRVKTTIFNVLQSRLGLEGIEVLDLFAGSGSLGLEALSRGGARCVFVDTSRHVLDLLEANVERLGCLDDCILIQADAEAFIGKTAERFDLIFADPPYAYEETHMLPQRITGNGLLKKNGYLIIEHTKQTSFPELTGHGIAVTKEFGGTQVSFFTDRHS